MRVSHSSFRSRGLALRGAARRWLASSAAFLAVASVGLAFAPTVGSAAEALAGDEEDRPVVTFSGFRAHDDRSSSIRVDMTRGTPVTHEQDGRTVRYLIDGAKIRWRNNKNPLRAQYFDSNVLSAKLDAVEKGVRLTIRLRTDTPTSHRVEKHSTGASLFVDVPAPKEPDSGASDEPGQKDPESEG